MAENTYTVQRTALIDAPPTRIYDEVADFHNWPHWSPWEDMDPDMQRSHSGAESGTGAVYAWSGNRKAGKGRMEIVEASPSSRVQIDLVFEKPWKARNDTVFTIEPEGSASRVTWTMTGKKTLMTRVMGVVMSMDKMIGRDFDKGLQRLKATVETPTAP